MKGCTRITCLMAVFSVGACAVDAHEEPEKSSAAESALNCGGRGAKGKVEICHATGSATQPFVRIAVSRHAVNGHRRHPGDLIPAPPEGCPGGSPGVCTPGSVAACYDGPAGTEGVGTCSTGTQVCNADGSAYGQCQGSVTPVTEVCGDSLDNDCDGIADDGCVCTPGTAAACYDGPAGTEGVGTCVAGSRLCNADGSGFGPCEGSVTPADDVCDDGLDNDCDGFVDSASSCRAEICSNGVDDNEDGLVDCADPDCAADPLCSTEASCGNGTDDDGDGLTDCAEPGCETNASCSTATEYFCNDGVDNDGDGLTDADEPACNWAASALPCAPGKLQTYEFSGPIAIPDPGTRSVNLVAEGPGIVGTVAVRVNITHVFDADVDILLASALSTTVDLSSDNGGFGEDFQNTVFVDTAPVSILAGAPPFAGSFRPEVALSTLAGQPVTGTWRGLVVDDAAGFQGTLHEYALAICIQ